MAGRGPLRVGVRRERLPGRHGLLQDRALIASSTSVSLTSPGWELSFNITIQDGQGVGGAAVDGGVWWKASVPINGVDASFVKPLATRTAASRLK